MDEEERKISDAVRWFARGTENKMIKKKREGFHGWDDPKMESRIRQNMADHVNRFLQGDETEYDDIANFCAMMERLKCMDKDKKPWCLGRMDAYNVPCMGKECVHYNDCHKRSFDDISHGKEVDKHGK